MKNFDQTFLDYVQVIKHLPHVEKAHMDNGTGAGLPGYPCDYRIQSLHLVEKSTKSQFLENCKSRLDIDYKVHNNSIADLSI